MEKRKIVIKKGFFDFSYEYKSKGFTKSQMGRKLKLDINLEGKNILIYGTGENAKKVLPRANEEKLNIVGVMDRTKVSGFFEGIPIVTWDDIYADDADVILIAASQVFLREIYGRILPYCKRRKIKIYEKNGQDLSDFFGNYSYRDLFENRYLDCASLTQEIEKYDVVSFDIFDTVLMRKVYEPTDIFTIVGIKAGRLGIQIPGFKKVRREAEIRAKGSCIEVIYDNLQKMLELTDEDRQRLLDLEIETELEYVTARADVLTLIKEVKAMGKTVIYVSDMYLPAEILRKFLVANGCYEGDEIYVSCEYGTNKSGGLFGFVTKKYEAAKCIHIGDHPIADMESPNKFGIKSAGIYKALDLFNIADLWDIAGYMDTIADRILIGQMIDSLFNSPFAFKDKYGVGIVDTIEKLTDIFLLPIVVEIVKGIENCLRKFELDGIIFGARDGYFFKKLYETLAEKCLIKKVPCFYIYISRILAIHIGLDEKRDIEEIIQEYDLFNNEDINNSIFKGEMADNILKSDKIDTVLEWSRMNKERYRSYLENCGIDLKKKYLYFELNGRGSIVKCLNRLFEEHLAGYYYLYKPKYALDIEYGRCYRDEICSPVYGRSNFLEWIFSSPERSVCSIKDDLILGFKEECRTEEEISFMLNVQDVLLNKTVNFIEKEISLDDLSISKDLIEQIFTKYGMLDFSKQVSCLNTVFFRNDLRDAVYDLK